MPLPRQTVQIRVSREQKIRWGAVATARHASVSTWITQVIEAHLKAGLADGSITREEILAGALALGVTKAEAKKVAK